MDALRVAQAQCLAIREEITLAIDNDPYNIMFHVRRSEQYQLLGYPDLAVMDAYKALLLMDEVTDENGEYHDFASSSLQSHISQELTESSNAQDATHDLPDFDVCCQFVEQHRMAVLIHIAKCLHLIGCNRPAYDCTQTALRLDRDNVEANEISTRIRSPCQSNPQTETQFRAADLPDRGYVRREVYPWNRHESQRTSEEALKLLNTAMQTAAPKLEVRATDLPILHSTTDSDPELHHDGTIQQLGVFATDNILPEEEILKERSLLTGNSRLHEPLCDACSAPLPTLSDTSADLTSCENCEDTVFCSQVCHDLAQRSYHPAICGTDIDTIAKDASPKKAADSLYTLLLFRALAMATTQNIHPLDLLEVKYIWGDFSTSDITPSSKNSTPDLTSLGEHIFLNSTRTLPFTFEDNILAPLHFLEMMETNIFTAGNGLAELWVWNTLYAKFRGTASARLSPRDGRPEVAAVHPLWCLANHSCDPNVSWEWAGEIKFTARKLRTAWWRTKEDGSRDVIREERQGGIQKGEEILNHYVDIDLPVKERREWGAGALGGMCMCHRCIAESTTSN